MPQTKVHIAEVVEPDEKLPKDLVALRRFSILMDEQFAIPGTPWRIGLDAGLGLIPGIGDVIAGVLSAWIVVGALRHRVPMRIIAVMVGNILVDLVLGAIPAIGDIFDFVFEENVINMRLLLKHRDRQKPPRTTGEVGLVAILIVSFIAMFAIALAVAVIAAIFYLLRGRSLL